jgi:hypothetical protein
MSTAVATPPEPNNRDKALAPFKEIRDALAPYPPERFIQLLPSTYLGGSPLFIPTPSLVTVDPRDERDVYKTPGSKDSDESVCLHAVALQRIANAAGIDFDPTMAFHRHDRVKDPWVCEQIAGGTYIDSLGQTRTIASGWVTQDLRDGSPRANLITRQGPVALQVARQFICEQCSTRARSKAIRNAVQMRGSYKKSELLLVEQIDGKTVTRPKPMVALRFRLDESDKDVKKALIDRATGARNQVFGIPELAAPEAPRGRDDLEDIEGEVIDTTATAAAGPKEPDVVEPEETAPADPVKPIVDHVEKIREGLHFNGKPWTDAARKKVPSDDQIGLFAGQVGKPFANLDPNGKKLLRRAVLVALFGSFVEYSELRSDQVSAAIDWSREHVDEVKALVIHLCHVDPALSGVRDQLAQQQELIKGAA